MGDCLTPTSWAIQVERREAPFLSPIASEAWRNELLARIAIWETWIAELDGCVFVEPKTARERPRFSYLVVGEATTTVARLDDRAAALALVAEMRAAGVDVRIEAVRHSPAPRSEEER